MVLILGADLLLFELSLFQLDDADVFDFGLIWPMHKACVGNCGGPGHGVTF